MTTTTTKLKCAVLECKDGTYEYKEQPKGFVNIDSIQSGVCDKCAGQGYSAHSGGGSSYVQINLHGICSYMYDIFDPKKKKCQPLK